MRHGLIWIAISGGVVACTSGTPAPPDLNSMKGQPTVAARATAKPCEEDDDNDGDGVIDERTLFAYDAYGREVKDVIYRTDSSPVGDVIYTWDDDTGRITHIRQDGFVSDWPDQDSDFKYDADGHLIESITDVSDPPGGKESLWVDYKQWNFDALGNAQNTSFYDQAQPPPVTDTDQLTFDAKGRQTDDERSMNGVLQATDKVVFDDDAMTSTEVYDVLYLYGTSFPPADQTTSTTTAYDGAGHPNLATSSTSPDPSAGISSTSTEVWVWNGDLEISDTTTYKNSMGGAGSYSSAWKYACKQ